MRIFVGCIVLLMFSLPSHSEEAQAEDNIFVIPILEGCKEHALDEIKKLVEYGKIKYRFREGIFLSYFMPKFIGYLEIEEFDNEARGISRHIGYQIYNRCMPTVPNHMEYSKGNIMYLSRLLLSSPYKEHKEKYIVINEDEIILYPILKEQVREVTPNKANSADAKSRAAD